MDVIDKRTEAESIFFKDVEWGVPFEFESSFFLKTNKSLCVNDVFTNAVNLKTGRICKFNEEDKVKLVNASIVIN